MLVNRPTFVMVLGETAWEKIQNDRGIMSFFISMSISIHVCLCVCVARQSQYSPKSLVSMFCCSRIDPPLEDIYGRICGLFFLQKI
jgi:hypothetical protein